MPSPKLTGWRKKVVAASKNLTPQRALESLVRAGVLTKSGRPRWPNQKNSVESTIEDCIAKYPSLFHSRTQVLHHMFMVLGCGFRWKRGCLVQTSDHNEPDKIPREAAKILAQHRTTDIFPYPVTRICNLKTMPECVRADWRAASEEVKEIIHQLSKTK